MVIVSLVLLILGLVIGGFLSSCYNNGCGQVGGRGDPNAHEYNLFLFSFTIKHCRDASELTA
jgi:hypothetical protein